MNENKTVVSCPPRSDPYAVYRDDTLTSSSSSCNTTFEEEEALGKAGGRQMCARCDRPSPSACICAALPAALLRLSHCRCLVLQHPQELSRKNRSLPIVQLCLHPDSITVRIDRRFGGQNSLSRLLRRGSSSSSSSSSSGSASGDTGDHNASSSVVTPADGPVWLVYPGPDSIPFHQALADLRREQQLQRRQHQTDSPAPSPLRVTLIFLDSTWKYAREMDNDNMRNGQYPKHMVRVALSTAEMGESFTPGRFDIRTPPSENHLCTAESISWVVSQIEGDATIHETIMKPLDLMVSKWRAFIIQANAKKRSKTEKT